MKKILFFVLSAFFICLLFPLLQPKTSPEFEAKYQLIKELLDQYERRFDVIEVGAGNGDYSFRIAKDYDALSVMIEGNHPPLLKRCKQKNLRNIIYLNKPVQMEDLKRLGECESFSVVLALHGMDWAGPNWKEAIDVMVHLGDHTILEATTEEMEAHLQTLEAKALGNALYLIDKEKTTIQRKTWMLNYSGMENYRIQSNFQKKELIKNMPEYDLCLSSDWIPGVNLLTFKMYHGIYPERKHLKREIKKLSKIRHNDWMVNNIIVSGKTLHLIDMIDPRHKRRVRSCSKKKLKTHLDLIAIDSPEEVESFYLHLIGHR